MERGGGLKEAVVEISEPSINNGLVLEKNRRKKKVLSFFFFGDLKQFPDLYPLLAELIVIERYNHLKREKRKRYIEHQEIRNLSHQRKKVSKSIQSWLSLK